MVNNNPLKYTKDKVDNMQNPCSFNPIWSKHIIGLAVATLISLPTHAENVSQQFTGSDSISRTLSKVLPVINYSTEGLSNRAKRVNSATWKSGQSLNRAVNTKIQALLNWNNHGVGAIDGYWGRNTRDAMRAFQKAKGITLSDKMNDETWKTLNNGESSCICNILVKYTLKDSDVNIKTTTIPSDVEAKSKLEGMYYQSVTEALAEKFHMSVGYLESLNPNVSFQSGQTITVYNPNTPSTKAVSRVVVDKDARTLYAYDSADNIVASYPTTVGSSSTPSPTGTHNVVVKAYEPNYTYTHNDGKKTIIPPGPNNPVGIVWIGLSKPSYGIHGSPEPERISRQASAGCIRLTNWDALALYGTIQRGATVELK